MKKIQIMGHVVNIAFILIIIIIIMYFYSASIQ